MIYILQSKYIVLYFNQSTLFYILQSMYIVLLFYTSINVHCFIILYLNRCTLFYYFNQCTWFYYFILQSMYSYCFITLKCRYMVLLFYTSINVHCGYKVVQQYPRECFIWNVIRAQCTVINLPWGTFSKNPPLWAHQFKQVKKLQESAPLSFVRSTTWVRHEQFEISSHFQVRDL